MQRSVVAVVERINKAGGILGRPAALSQDDQTAPRPACARRES
jgi:hypothetical protein